MKRTILVSVLLFIAQYSFCQTNIFPSNGNVGIGVANPSSPLQVRGYVERNWLASFENMGTDGHKLYLGYNDNTSTTYGLWITGGRQLANQIDFGVEHKFFVMGDGNVGIGYNAPSEKLSVNGNIKANGNIVAKKIIVTQSGWPDYVFQSSYKLKPLTALERYVRQNHRLPEMPAAKEVEKKGISMGDMQALLLKKIEELTLYMIEMKKENKQQQQEINLLKQKLKQ